MIPQPRVTLQGEVVRLEPMSADHVPALVAAASIDRATYGLTFVPDGIDAMRDYVAAALAAQAAGSALPFVAVLREGGRVVGATRFGHLESWPWPANAGEVRAANEPDAGEIGWTWLAADVQRSRVNTEQKLLMLRHGFEAWRLHRVTLITDARNARSRAAIERLGARLDGTIRAHFPAADGTIRDSAAYSILRAEWPEVQARLEKRLGARPA